MTDVQFFTFKKKFQNELSFQGCHWEVMRSMKNWPEPGQE